MPCHHEEMGGILTDIVYAETKQKTTLRSCQIRLTYLLTSLANYTEPSQSSQCDIWLQNEALLHTYSCIGMNDARLTSSP